MKLDVLLRENVENTIPINSHGHGPADIKMRFEHDGVMYRLIADDFAFKLKNSKFNSFKNNVVALKKVSNASKYDITYSMYVSIVDDEKKTYNLSSTDKKIPEHYIDDSTELLKAAIDAVNASPKFISDINAYLKSYGFGSITKIGHDVAYRRGTWNGEYARAGGFYCVRDVTSSLTEKTVKAYIAKNEKNEAAKKSKLETLAKKSGAAHVVDYESLPDNETSDKLDSIADDLMEKVKSYEYGSILVFTSENDVYSVTEYHSNKKAKSFIDAALAAPDDYSLIVTSTDEYSSSARIAVFKKSSKPIIIDKNHRTASELFRDDDDDTGTFVKRYINRMNKNLQPYGFYLAGDYPTSFGDAAAGQVFVIKMGHKALVIGVSLTN